MRTNLCSIISDQINEDIKIACKKAKEEGFSYIELHNVFGKSIEECSDIEVEEIKNILDASGLKVSAIASTVFFLAPLYENYKVSLFNDAFHAITGDISTHLEYLKRACKIAKKLDCSIVRVFPFRYPDNEDVVIVGTEKDREEIKKHLIEAGNIAASYDIMIAVENCPYSHCPKGEMTYRMIKEIAHPNVGLLWDPANSYRAERKKVPQEFLSLNLKEEFELLKDNIVHVHLKNYHYDETQTKPFIHTAFLNGDIPFEEMWDGLSKLNCKLSLEPEVSYEETLSSMKDLIKLSQK